MISLRTAISFVTESAWTVLRAPSAPDGRSSARQMYSGRTRPAVGIAFYPNANPNLAVMSPKPIGGRLHSERHVKALSAPEVRSGTASEASLDSRHLFSPDGRRMFNIRSSASNYAEQMAEKTVRRPRAGGHALPWARPGTWRKTAPTCWCSDVARTSRQNLRQRNPQLRGSHVTPIDRQSVVHDE